MEKEGTVEKEKPANGGSGGGGDGGGGVGGSSDGSTKWEDEGETSDGASETAIGHERRKVRKKEEDGGNRCSSSAKKTLRFISVRFFQCRRRPDDNSQARYTLCSSLRHTGEPRRSSSVDIFLRCSRIASHRTDGTNERTNERTNEWVTPRCAHRTLVNRIVLSPVRSLVALPSPTTPLGQLDGSAASNRKGVCSGAPSKERERSACRCVWSTYRGKGGPWHAEAGRSLAGCSPVPSIHCRSTTPARLEIYSHPRSRTSTYRRVRFGDIESALSLHCRCSSFVSVVTLIHPSCSISLYSPVCTSCFFSSSFLSSSPLPSSRSLERGTRLFSFRHLSLVPSTTFTANRLCRSLMRNCCSLATFQQRSPIDLFLLRRTVSLSSFLFLRGRYIARQKT